MLVSPMFYGKSDHSSLHFMAKEEWKEENSHLFYYFYLPVFLRFFRDKNNDIYLFKHVSRLFYFSYAIGRKATV